MNRIEQLLSVGDLRMAGNSEVVVKMVLARPELLADVVNVMLGEHPASRMRAADAMEKITRHRPQWLTPYKQLFLRRLAAVEQKEVRWHMAQMLPRLTLTRAERGKVFAILQRFLEDDSRIVKTFAMQALADLALQDRDYIGRVRDIIRTLSVKGSPAMQSRGRKLLAVLESI